jgi:hypothetical protein
MTREMTSADWRSLRALRDRFLTDATEDYWAPGDLELYDATFAQRIGWKWDGVIATLDRAGWRPSARRLLDWGCGSGVASRTAAAWSGISDVRVHDQSAMAVKFAVESLRTRGIEATAFPPGESIAEDTLLVVSHVAGELSVEEISGLAKMAAGAVEVIWVEPGSHEISPRLAGVRQILMDGGHRMVAPCTHQAECPMSVTGRDWCHFFASPPPEVFQSAFWREFSDQMGIDLRALPFSFLASSRLVAPQWEDRAERLIGRPRVLKGRCELLCCGSGGLATRELQKRDEPELFRRLCRDDLDGVFQWEMDPAKPHRIARGQLI